MSWKKALIVLIPLILVALVIPSQISYAVSNNGVAETIQIPSPIGYSYTFVYSPPYYVVGYYGTNGVFYPYNAQTYNTSDLVYVGYNPNFITKLYDSYGVVHVNVINPENIVAVYGVITKNNDYVIYSGGQPYVSQYNIWFNHAPPNYSQNDLVITSNYVDFKWNGSKLLAITSLAYNYVDVATQSGVFSMPLSQLIGVNSQCISQFTNPPPNMTWIGGIVDTPACTSNIKPLLTVTYANMLFIVAFSVNTNYGYLNYVLLGNPSPVNLQKLQIISPIGNANNSYHIVLANNLNNQFVYIVPFGGDVLESGSVVSATSETQTLSNGQLACVLPQDASPVYYLLWKYRELNQTLYLEPGEFILYQYNGSYYYCSGDLSWLSSTTPPSVKAPRYSEFTFPIYVYNTLGQTFLVILSNGLIYEGPSVHIPWNTYKNNFMYLAFNTYISQYSVHVTSFFLSPTFAIGAIIVVVSASVILSSRPEKTREKIKIIMDVAPPQPLKFTDNDTINQIARRHVENFGVCPTVTELAELYKVLAPIPRDMPEDSELIVCPYNTWDKSELTLRKVANVLSMGFWRLVRVKSNAGYAYTIIGESIPYVYVYKQERNDSNDAVIIKAIESIRSIKFETPFEKKPLGLVIVVPPENLDAVKKELSTLETLSGVSSEVGNPYNISVYIATKRIETSLPIDELQKIIQDLVPTIIVVSDTNLTELIEKLKDTVLALFVSYDYARGDLDEDEL